MFVDLITDGHDGCDHPGIIHHDGARHPGFNGDERFARNRDM